MILTRVSRSDAVLDSLKPRNVNRTLGSRFPSESAPLCTSGSRATTMPMLCTFCSVLALQYLEHKFYSERVPFSETCPRCNREFDEPLWTVTIYLPATEPNWMTLCADCFRVVLQIEPPEQLGRQNLKKIWRRREGR